MKREVVDCDRCGTPNVRDPQTITVVVGTQRDPTGTSENVTESVDLCPTCLGKELRLKLAILNDGESLHWVMAIRERGNKK